MCGLGLKIQLFVIIETAPYLHLEIGSFNLPVYINFNATIKI